ncbi:MAG: TetR family transcriptional regulator [Parvibaculum sp.]|uniref:TetR/AcrR family transcriptional regulator n=1 Tax=Parvibaculum sp. TaxID=2024848 RepID=UPI002846316E|nr:TetR family transcriptional regulator [Parvibaculum sp.]MDR3498821.1 TetR family transcriptional regulator [Parvibaculum sp.]
MATKDTITVKRSDTRTQLILAAEKLFGDRGIHSVTLKEINLAAGQRNESALHYHFGSKAALVEAIMQYRVKMIDARRIANLDALEREGGEGDLRSLLLASFMPMAELLGTEEGVRFIRFLAQVLNDPDFDLPSIALRSDFEGIRRSNALIIAALGDLPPEIAILRQRFIVEMAVSSLAIWTRHNDAVADAAGREFFCANLFDSIVGFLTAPISTETLESLKRATKKKDRK